MTGSTSGIGLGIACRFAAQATNIVPNGFGDVAAAQRLIGEFDVRHSCHDTDIGQPVQIEALLSHAARVFGAVDVLVNNSGNQHVANAEDFPSERWDAILAINLSSTFRTTRLALPSVKARRWGRVINIASTLGLVASARKAACVAAKHGSNSWASWRSSCVRQRPTTSLESLAPSLLAGRRNSAWLGADAAKKAPRRGARACSCVLLCRR